MIGCVLGGLALLGLVRMWHFRRHGFRRCWPGWHHHHHGDHFSPGGWGGGRERWGFGPRAMLRGLMQRLETTPAQEEVIRAAAHELREAGTKLRGEVKRSRADVAAAFRRTSFDEVAMGELFARHDTEMESLRRAFVGAGAKIHEALDERQRARLADMIGSPRGVVKAEGSLGLGLVLVRRIADAHRGTLSTANLPERGARVTLEISVG